MKEIEIDNRKLKYQTIYWCDEGGDYVWTEFYEGEKEVTIKKWNWKKFRYDQEQKIIPKKIFQIGASSENSRLTKDWWREKIKKELEILDRPNQLKKGELI